MHLLYRYDDCKMVFMDVGYMVIGYLGEQGT